MAAEFAAVEDEAWCSARARSATAPFMMIGTSAMPPRCGCANSPAALARRLGCRSGALEGARLPDSLASSICAYISLIYSLWPARGMYPGVMGTTQAAANRARYQSRPGRTPLVVAGLAELQGPTQGTVELPLRLFWSAPDRRFDLADPDMLRSMYEKVLRDAIRMEDLTRFLNGGTLLAVWRDLFLPRDVRRAWEDRHPVLRRAATAA